MTTGGVNRKVCCGPQDGGKRIKIGDRARPNSLAPALPHYLHPFHAAVFQGHHPFHQVYRSCTTRSQCD